MDSSTHIHFLPSNTTLAPHEQPDMLAWSRLPTPIPHDLLSPPHSAASSPRLSISTSTASTSTSGSHGSYALPSPLPSPLEPSPSAKYNAPASGSKTAAFFASPFSASSGPAPPPPPPRPPPTRSTSLNITIDASTPQPQREPEPTPTASRSATADFFSSNGATAAWRPTPPPSLKSSSASSTASSSSREPSPPPPRLPPISRFFPSRYTSEAHRIEDDEDDVIAGGYEHKHAHFDASQHEEQEPERRFDRDHTKNAQRRKLVPTSGDWETSFKRAFLSLAKKVDPLHTHTNSHATSPTCERGHDRERTLSPPALRRDSSEGVSSDTVTAAPHSASYPILPNPHSHPHLSQLHHPQSHASHAHAHAQAHPIRRETLHKKNFMPLTLPVPVPASSAAATSSPASDGEDNIPGSYRAGSILCAESGDECDEKDSKTDKTKASKVQLELLEPLGEGAFSSVWLARDLSNSLSHSYSRSLSHSRSRSRKHGRNDSSTSNASNASEEAVRLVALESIEVRSGAQRGVGKAGAGKAGLGAGFRRKSESRAKRGSDSRRMHGIRPTANVGVGYRNAEAAAEGDESLVLGEMDGEMFASVKKLGKDDEKKGRGNVVAVKMMNRALCDANDRTRISFVREVEVLRHISHPSIVSYLHSFTTHTHHALVLEYVGGGELFTLVNSDAQYTRVTEGALRRIWGELARAVGWMHGVGLVHRDVKLESACRFRFSFFLLSVEFGL